MNVISPEIRMMGLPYGEEIMIVGQTVTDGKTVTRTELRSQRPCNAERRTVKMLYNHAVLQIYTKTLANKTVL